MSHADKNVFVKVKKNKKTKVKYIGYVLDIFILGEVKKKRNRNLKITFLRNPFLKYTQELHKLPFLDIHIEYNNNKFATFFI